jgi:hypothetical protein
MNKSEKVRALHYANLKPPKADLCLTRRPMYFLVSTHMLRSADNVIPIVSA